MKRKFVKTRYSEEYENERGALETIEKKIARITENNEPITDGVEIIYTKRSDGVQAQYNIRADKWAISQEAMEKVANAKKGTIAKKLRGTEQPTEQPKEQPTEQPTEQQKGNN